MSSEFIIACQSHSQNALHWVLKQIAPTGSLVDYPADITCYYKLPYLLAITGQHVLAQQVLEHIKTTFFINNQFAFDRKKSKNSMIELFWGYVVGWIAMGAHKLDSFDISYPAYEYLRTFHSQDHGGYAKHGPWGEKDEVLDTITSAHLGRLSLYFGHKKEAIKTGEFLSWNIANQPNIQEFLYLNVDNQKTHVTDFKEDEAWLQVVKKNSPQQAYFMIGYPIAYLVELFTATKKPDFLLAAGQYADFALHCDKSIESFHYSHKVAWGMSLLYRYTKEEKYLKLCESIGQYLIGTQDESGCWLKSDGQVTSMDQTVEIAIWLQEIAGNLS